MSLEELTDPRINVGPPFEASAAEKRCRFLCTYMHVALSLLENKKYVKFFWWADNENLSAAEALRRRLVFHGPFDTEQAAQQAADFAVGDTRAH
jgi:hypothetical protein